jgi:2-keto-4-pentenoate hydratase/2-oxohepta-3-ene-1,7-dioic acid hydratase in catechol pathway
VKLATIARDGQTIPVLISGDGYVDIPKHLPNLPGTLIDIIRSWNEVETALKTLSGREVDGLVCDVRLEPPIARPGKIFAIGLNYADHCEETGTPLPHDQVWFSKASTAVTGPFSPIHLPTVSEQLDYEAEMVVVIGRTCRNVPEERYQDVVFGYCVGNDVSIRDWQMATSQYTLGKSFDTSAPFGPWITTADEVDPDGRSIRAYVNGELRQNSNTKHLVFKVAAMVSKLSHAMTLEPGDILFTGTPSGVGLAQQGGPKFLKWGDRSRIEIDGLGAIENIVENGPVETIIK